MGSETDTATWALPFPLWLEFLTRENLIKCLYYLKAWGVPGKNDPC